MENYLKRGTTPEELQNLCYELAAYDADLIRHCVRVGSLAALLAETLHFTQYEIDCIQIAGVYHDYGKTMVPKSVIFKRGLLTMSERDCIEQHVQDGVDHLQLYFKSSLILKAIAEHHERLDGTGYPNGLFDISPYGRILAVCDVFDALVHARRYKRAMLPDEAMSILYKDVNIKFDLRVVNALNEIIKEDKLYLYDCNLHTNLYKHYR